MSIVTAIYKAPIVCSDFDPDFGSIVGIKYNGQLYSGCAYLHPEDKDFFSKKVAKNIALSRARTEAMKTELERERTSYKERQNFARLRSDLTKDLELNYLLKRQQNRCINLREAIKREKYNLKKYIEGQNMAVLTVKNMRKKDKID